MSDVPTDPAAREPAPSLAPSHVGGEPESAERRDDSAGVVALYAAVFIAAICGLVYELVAGAMASYLLGDSVTQFSFVIGLYLSAMGLGSYLSKFVRGDLLETFLRIEIAVGVVGGLSSLAMFVSYAYLGSVRLLLFGLVGVIGTLVGLEIPVLMRVLRDEVSFADLVARVLAFDYLGALAASLMFPLLLVPALGLPRTAFAFGLLNTLVALALTYALRERLGGKAPWIRAQALAASLVLVVGFVGAEQVTQAAEEYAYDAPVIFKEKTPYQEIMVTRWHDDVRLLLDKHLQLSSIDEHRYHEALVHPAVAALRAPPRTALVLGGGDGMALREVLRYPSVERAVLVDLDPAMTRLFSSEPLLAGLNGNAYADPRVEVVNADAMKWLEEHHDVFDLIVMDFPDPRAYGLAKLYTRGFYRLVHRHLAKAGALVTQATSPYGPPNRPHREGSRAFWCIERTLSDAGFTTHPYHCHVPSFGEWGFVLALPTPAGAPQRLAPEVQGLRFLNDDTLRAMFAFPEDLRAPDDVEVNRLNSQILIRYYQDEWGSSPF